MSDIKEKEIVLDAGKHIVYPAHGVGKIVGTDIKTVLGEKIEFYVINMIDTNMEVLVPSSNVKNVGIRDLVSEKEIEEIFGILSSKAQMIVNSAWNRRYRNYMSKIKSGSLHEIAEVYRDLASLKTKKELSFGERKMLDTTKHLISKEISVAKNTEESKVLERINEISQKQKEKIEKKKIKEKEDETPSINKLEDI